MENKRPLILVSNDDGIMAKGISELIKFLRPLGEIVVMAPDFDAAGPYVRRIAAMVLAKGLPPLTCLNVNFPNTQEIKGVRICEQAKGHWSGEWQACPRRDDANFYWLTGEFIDHEPENEKNDHWALANGYVAITPTVVDMTAYHFMDELKSWEL